MSENIVHFFKALSDSTRLRLLNLTIHFELNVNEIVKIMGMGQSRISRHLKILTDSGLISFRREGLWIFYSAVSSGEGSDYIQSIRYLFEQSDIFRKDLANAKLRIAERSKKSARFFNTIGGRWDSLKQEIYGNFDINQKILSSLPKVDTIVDLGCGTGDLLPALKAKASKIIGVEKSLKMLEEARKHFDADHDRIDIRIGELEHLPLRDGEADAAYSNMVLHHLSHPQAAFQEAYRILRRDGLFLVIDLLPHQDESMRDRFGDLWLGFSPEVMSRWLHESGFIVTKTDRFNLQRGLKGFILHSKKNKPISEEN